ncbi:Uncharacterised protein [Listeria monocytogenes]|nr:Uncharacterised protein [Listeria monocytogenes]
MDDGYEVEKEPKCESEKLYIIEIDKNYMFHAYGFEALKQSQKNFNTL